MRFTLLFSRTCRFWTSWLFLYYSGKCHWRVDNFLKFFFKKFGLVKFSCLFSLSRGTDCIFKGTFVGNLSVDPSYCSKITIHIASIRLQREWLRRLPPVTTSVTGSDYSQFVDVFCQLVVRFINLTRPQSSLIISIWLGRLEQALT